MLYFPVKYNLRLFPAIEHIEIQNLSIDLVTILFTQVFTVLYHIDSNGGLLTDRQLKLLTVIEYDKSKEISIYNFCLTVISNDIIRINKCLWFSEARFASSIFMLLISYAEIINTFFLEDDNKSIDQVVCARELLVLWFGSKEKFQKPYNCPGQI